MALLATLVGAGSVLTGPAGIAVVVGTAVAGVVAWRWRWWRATFAVTLIFLAGSASSQPVIAEFSFWPRYIAAAVLVAMTWTVRTGSQVGEPLSTAARWLMASLWVVTTVAFASAAWSVVPGFTIQQSVALLLLVMFTHGVVRNRWCDSSVLTRDLAVATVVLGGTLAAGIAMDVVGLPSTRSQPTGRLQGFYINPNATAMVAVLSACLAFAVWRELRSRGYMLLLLLSVVTVVMTESRTGVLAILAASLWVVVRAGLGASVKVALAVGFGSLILWIAPSGAGFPSLTAFDRAAGVDLLSGRSVAWQVAIDLWREHPVAGHGYRTGEVLFTTVRSVASLHSGVTAAHNSYLQVLFELGIVGTIPVLVAVIVIGAAMLRAPMEGVYGGASAAVVSGLVIMLSESAMFGTGNPFPWIFWPLAAVLANVSGQRRDAPQQGRSTVGARPVVESRSTSGARAVPLGPSPLSVAR